MKALHTLFWLLYLLDPIRSKDHNEGVFEKASLIGEVDAVRQLLVRLLGQEKSSLFNVNIIPNESSSNEVRDESKDYFTISKKKEDTIVFVKGSSAVAAAWGIHHYLRHFCNCHLSWEYNRIQLPLSLPEANVNITANDRLRYYQNVCTYGYSFVWWDWSTYWEPHLDWMALNGLNLALAPIGQEMAWKAVYLQLGLTQQEISEYFTGPAFLPWNRMGNLRGWSGPLTDSWHNNQYSLQKKILKRMVELGIMPIFPAFSGIVPRSFKRIFPDANLTKMSNWNNFEDSYCCPYYLSPVDPLFGKIGSMFLREYRLIYGGGENQMYSCDPFNEMTPPNGTNLKAAGNSIFSAMTSVDKGAIWVLQGWMFQSGKYYWTKTRSKEFLTSVPLGRILVLDLQSEKTPQYDRLDNYFGQPYIWCMLHNFGGTLGLHGSASKINTAVYMARKATNSTMIGVGLTPEGINQNYVIYELMLENSWKKEPSNLTEWFDKYTQRRYGATNKHSSRAWQLLKDSVYNYNGSVAQHGRYTFVRRPSLNIVSDTWYDPNYVYQAWDEFLEASVSGLNSTSTFLYDLVDVTRQAAQLILDEKYTKMVTAFRLKMAKKFEKYSSEFLGLIEDLDYLLATNQRFLIGNWIAAAKSFATSPLELALYERNARNLITLWGPNGEIRDYANRQWSGLVADYYLKRWELFVDALRDCLISGRPFNQNAISSRIFRNVEQPFMYSKKTYPHIPQGDSIEVSKMIHTRWRPPLY